MRDFKDIHWLGNDVCRIGSTRVLASIVPNSRHEGMWHVRVGTSGKLTDMVNLARARDAATVAALAIVNGEKRPQGHPTSRISRRAA